MSAIAIDARESGTSTGRYIDKLIEHLHALQPQHDITVLAKPHRVDYLKSKAPNFKIVESSYKEFTFDEQLKLLKQINNLRPDLMHFGKDHQPILYRGKTITTMHDLTTMRFINPDKNPAKYKAMQAVYRQVVKTVAKSSDLILTPTYFVKNDIVTYTGVPADKIKVTYEAADAIADKSEPAEQVAGKRYIMYIGRPTPHKNLWRLIEAFKELKGEHPDLHLVLAGKLDANYQQIQQKTQHEQITNVIFTDFITDGQLRWLYEHTDAYVFPSLSEGFGLPGLEAMIHGAPVVSSNATCLPEVYGEAAYYFDPGDVQDMSKAINQVLTDDQLRSKLIAAGHVQAAKYSWRTMAEQTLDAYNQILSRD